MRAVFLVLLGLHLAGCAGSNGQVEAGKEERVSPSDLAASMEVKVGVDGVRLVLHLTNTTSRTMEFTFPTSQRYDFVVTRPSGEEVWRWSEGMAFLQAISRATLEPGESWDMEAVWDPGDRSGELIATGRLTARDRAVEQSATFELP
jgi:hypothetical protein